MSPPTPASGTSTTRPGRAAGTRSRRHACQNAPATLFPDDDADALDLILENIPEIVILVDRKGVIRYISRVEPGYDLDRVLGMRADAIMVPESKAVFMAALEAALSAGKTIDYEVQTGTPDGGTAWYQSRVAPYRRGKSIVGAVLLATNITELKRARATMDQFRRLLPVCAWCDRIHSPDGSWEHIHTYLKRHVDEEITHGVCPDCHRREIQGLGPPGAAPRGPRPQKAEPRNRSTAART